MPSSKRLRSVLHSLAHHGVSAMSFLHPRLGEYAKDNQLDAIAIDLIDISVISEAEVASGRIKRASQALRRKFQSILVSENISIDEIASAKIVFFIKNTHWPSGCFVRATTTEGRDFEVAVDRIGNLAEVLL